MPDDADLRDPNDPSDPNGPKPRPQKFTLTIRRPRPGDALHGPAEGATVEVEGTAVFIEGDPATGDGPIQLVEVRLGDAGEFSPAQAVEADDWSDWRFRGLAPNAGRLAIGARARLRTASGPPTYASDRVEVDVTLARGPEASIGEPADDALFQGLAEEGVLVTIRGTSRAGEESGAIDRVELLLGDQPGLRRAFPVAEGDWSSWSYPWRVTEAGRHEITAYAIPKAAGDRQAQARVSVRVELRRTPPPAESRITTPVDRSTLPGPATGLPLVVAGWAQAGEGGAIRSLTIRVGDGAARDLPVRSPSGPPSDWRHEELVRRSGTTPIVLTVVEDIGRVTTAEAVVEVVLPAAEIGIDQPAEGQRVEVSGSGARLIVSGWARPSDPARPIEKVEVAAGGGPPQPATRLGDDWSRWRAALAVNRSGDLPIVASATLADGAVADHTVYAYIAWTPPDASVEVVLHELGESLASTVAVVQRELARYPGTLGAYQLDDVELRIPVRLRLDELGQIRATVVDADATGGAIGHLQLRVRPVPGATPAPAVVTDRPLSALSDALYRDTQARLEGQRVFTVEDLLRVASRPAGQRALAAMDPRSDVNLLLSRAALLSVPALPSDVARALVGHGFRTSAEFAEADAVVMAGQLSAWIGRPVTPQDVAGWQKAVRDWLGPPAPVDR